MTRIGAFLGAAALVVTIHAPAAAQGLLGHCSADIEAYCADVAPGDGRVMSCLYAHSATITDECHAATDEMARLMEAFFDRISDVSEACSAELQEHCAEVSAGEGRKFQCLEGLGPELSAGCSGMLGSMRR